MASGVDESRREPLLPSAASGPGRLIRQDSESDSMLTPPRPFRTSQSEWDLQDSSPSPAALLQSLGRWMMKYTASILILLIIWTFCIAASSAELVDTFNWQSYLVIGLTSLALVLMINNCPPELVMLAVTLTLRVFGIITEEQAWSGFHSEGILAIGVLFVVAKCLEEAGTLESLVGIFLGKSKNLHIAILQLTVPVACVSSFVNDTPVVAMMIPLVMKWANTNGLPASKFLIPLSFAAMLGGMNTLIGTSTNLILAELLVQDRAKGNDPGFQLKFFSMTPVAVPVSILGIIYMTLVSKFILPDTGTQEGGRNGDENKQEGRRMYQVSCVATAVAEGKSAAEMGFLRVTGARLLEIRPGPNPVDGDSSSRSVSGDPQRVGGTTSQPMAPMDVEVQAGRQGNRGASKTGSTPQPIEVPGEVQELSERRLQAGDLLQLEGTADAISKLRKIQGLAATAKSKLHAELGPRRRRRCLVEVVVDRRCPLVGTSVDEADTLSLYNAAIFAVRLRSTMFGIPPLSLGEGFEGERRENSINISVDTSAAGSEDTLRLRGPRTQEEGAKPRTPRSPRLPGLRPGIFEQTREDNRLRPGDTLLLETYPNFMASYADSDHFALVRLIDDSAPPRHDQFKDQVRRVAAGGIYVTSVVLVATGVLSLLVAMTIAAFLLVGIQCVTIHAAFRSVKGRVVLAAIAAFGLGDGLTNTNITAKVAEQVVALGQDFGPIWLLFFVYLTTAALTSLVGNQATVIILYSIVKRLDVPGVGLEQLVIVIIIGASSSFVTPFSYQTNLMVWRAGGYSFANYAQLGFPLVLLSGATAAVLSHYVIPNPNA